MVFWHWMWDLDFTGARTNSLFYYCVANISHTVCKLQLTISQRVFNQVTLFKIVFCCLCYYSCPKFFLSVPLHTGPPAHSLRQPPHCCPCPWGLHVCSLATPFPVLSVHPHDCSVTTYLYFSVPPPFHPPLPNPSHLPTIKMFSVSMIPLLFCLFIFFRFNCR